MRAVVFSFLLREGTIRRLSRANCVDGGKTAELVGSEELHHHALSPGQRKGEQLTWNK